MKRTVSLCAAIALLTVTLFLLLDSGREAPEGRGNGGVAQKSAQSVKKGRTARRQVHAAKRQVRASDEGRGRSHQSETDDALSPKDRRVMDEIQSALDDEKFSDIKKLAAVSQSSSTEVRQKMVEALEWFGERALPEIVPFLADADEDVRSSAMNAVEQALLQIEDERAKARHIETLAMVKGACSEDGLAMMSGQLNGLSDSAVAVATAVRIIQSSPDPAAVEEMKEVYRFHTDEDYTTLEAAERWFAQRQADLDSEQASQ